MKNMMININKCQLIPLIILLITHSFCILGSDLSELKPYLRKSISWKCTTQDKEIPMNIYFYGGSTGTDGSEVIVYVKNSAWERVGQESDLSILNDYIKKKFIVITIDFGSDKLAVSPRFDKDLHEIFKAVYGYKTESLLKNLGLVPKEYRCFFLPEGYRVATDLVYWEIDKHAVYGTLEYIMKSYNEDIVPKLPGLKPVSSPKEMVDRYGNLFDFTVKMDIVYPSHAKKKLPVIVYSAWQAARNPNGEPIGYLPHFAGFTTRGYIYVVMGHCYNPCVVHYFHYSKFTLDAWNGLACYTAAMRYINANAAKYSINTDHIGIVGHSKGEYAVTRLSDPHHDGGKEISRFDGFPDGSPEPQPWQGYPSKISAGYQSMGMGLFEPEYITPDYVPTIVACGENERDVISKEGHPAFVKRLEELDVNYINLFMQGLGHEIPWGYDERMGVDRYRLMHDFFDRYLKAEEKLPPVILIVSPRDNNEEVSPTSEISIDFAPVIDSQSIVHDKGIMIIRTKNNREVDGTWKISHGGTRYTFIPYHAFIKNEKYSIIVTTKVKDKAGTHFDLEKTLHFKIAPV
jgi:Bacterial Ig-like domain